MDTKPMRRVTSARQDATGMDITNRCTLGDPNKLPEGVPQPARMPYVSDKHPRQTLEVINLLRKHRELCDVVLVVGAKKIYAHRVILSACSPYFRAMFTGELAESRQTEVVIRDIDERAMELLIDFAYTSQVTVEEGNVQTLLPAACLLQLAEIQEACCEFLKRQLDPSNCLGIRAFADTHSCRELLRIADKFTQHNFQEHCSPTLFPSPRTSAHTCDTFQSIDSRIQTRKENIMQRERFSWQHDTRRRRRRGGGGGGGGRRGVSFGNV
uniref:Kelch-like protein 20 n=1 Tax=Cyclopterus lumpus TaxID=8103 RepID=A0A8C3AUA4_CYCLU